MSGCIETLGAFANFVSRRLGLHFPQERLPELAQKMAAQQKAAGFDDLQAYLLSLMAAPLTKEKLQAVAAALTIGETYFLRDPRSYRLLQEKVLPGLVAARRRSGKELRIWSAGCSSGEEPYTVAILLCRALPDIADWKVTLIGSDINPLALERGRRGVYSKWSFRNAPEWLMEYFTEQPDGNYRIVPRIREMVQFIHLNLADPQDLSSPLTRRMDVIFCRNVMLYFHKEQIGETLGQFHASLAKDGWLFLGPTEVDHQSVPGFVSHQHDGALVLRKVAPGAAKAKARLQAPVAPPLPAVTPAKAPAPAAPPPPAAPTEAAPSLPAREEDPLPGAQALYQAGAYEESALAALAVPGAKNRVDCLSLAARAFANVGRYDDARALCEKALEIDRLNAANQYLLAIVLEHQGDLEQAAAALKKALYIDHDHLLAYFALGNLCRLRGDRREARQNFANALRLLERRDPAEVIADTEGMTAGALATTIRSMAEDRRNQPGG